MIRYLFRVLKNASLFFLSRIPYVNEILYKVSKSYGLIYREHSYDMRTNGEYALIKAIAVDAAFSSPVIFDVGANVGEWSKLVKKEIPSTELHCFEIHKGTVKSLRCNLEGLSNVYINEYGLSNKNSELEFLDYGENSGANSFVTRNSFKHPVEPYKNKAKTLTGDTYVKKAEISNIDFLKIDVEGWEYYVLEGFKPMLLKKSISLIQFEYGYANGDVHTLMKDFFLLLQECGYKIAILKRKGCVFCDFHHSLNDFDSGPNYIASCLENTDRLEEFM